tara:strand:- start:166 stop:312 length:147 start_codon:yes stop_codon:yes gene_type:complete
MREVSKEVKSLIEKAEKAELAVDALQFSQAAVNAANATAVFANMPKED